MQSTPPRCSACVPLSTSVSGNIWTAACLPSPQFNQLAKCLLTPPRGHETESDSHPFGSSACWLFWSSDATCLMPPAKDRH